MVKVKLNRGNTQKPHTLTLRKRRGKKYKAEPKTNKKTQKNKKESNQTINRPINENKQ